jgi:hypothetical protein
LPLLPNTEKIKKKKTSISPNPTLWSNWSVYVLRKTGNSKNITSETEKAITEYMKNNPL